jgi:lactate dehydrogenase-like 2-hydroxyacid dehydrogenase
LQNVRPAVLLLQPFLKQIEAGLDEKYEIFRVYDAAKRESLLAEVAPHVRGVVTGGAFGLPRPIMDSLPRLEIIAINGIGTDAVDLEEARRRDVRVTTTPHVLTDDVADMAMALILATSRNLCSGDRFVRAGRWRMNKFPLARKVTGKRIGLIGLGRVGRAIAKRAEGFNMAVAYTDVQSFEDVPYLFVPKLEELAQTSDVLVVAASGGPQSKGIVNRAVLDALGPEGILINVGRGSIVDEPALVAALMERRLGGAGLDVFADEPNVPEALWHMDNVVLQPHQASATIETRLAMGELILANLAAHFAGQPVLTAAV